MGKVVVGVVSAPGLPEKSLKGVMDSLNDLDAPSMDEDIDWDTQYKTDPLSSSAEYVNEIFERLDAFKEDLGWDMAIAITDLPSVSNKKVVISEFDYDRKLSLISVPAIGMVKSKQKLETLLIHHMETLHDQGSTEDAMEVQPDFINRIAEVKSMEDKDGRYRYILKSTPGGWIRLIGGMTALNEPLKEIGNFRTIIALAFATGTYISIFRTPWELSLDYSAWRLILVMLIAVAGMVGWLIYAHNLWEMRSGRSQPVYRWLYNFTTLMTLLILAMVGYVVVSLLLTISILIFVPMGLFETWTDPNIEVNVEWFDYLNLIWFATSAGILAGAFGSTVEEEEKIRGITYSYRQWYRYRQLEQEKEEASKTDEKDSDETKANDENDEEESYSGEKQAHDEAEEEK